MVIVRRRATAMEGYKVSGVFSAIIARLGFTICLVSRKCTPYECLEVRSYSNRIGSSGGKLHHRWTYLSVSDTVNVLGLLMQNNLSISKQCVKVAANGMKNIVDAS